MKIAVFPGSFDPITIGHESIVRRAAELFDKLIISIGHNNDKKGFYSIEQRLEWINKIFAEYNNIESATYTGLTVDFCKEINANYILRGLRTAADFEFERSIGQMNKKIYPEIETVFLLTTPEHTMINSSIIRDIIRNGGDANQFVPNEVDLLQGRMK